MSNIPPQAINDIVNVLNPQQQHLFNAFMNNNNNVNRNMQMGMNPAVVANPMPNNMNNMANNQQLFNTFRALQQPMNQNNNNNLMNGQTPLNNANGQAMNMNMNMNVQNNNIPMQNMNNNNDPSNYLLQFLQQQLTTPNNNNNLRNPGKQVMPNNTTIVQQTNGNGMISNEQQMMGGFTNGMDANTMNINNMNMTNMANMNMSNVNAMNNMNNMTNMGNPSTPMSQMTGGTVPNTITMSAQQRSTTPLSNNSGGVLSSNTNTTTNTQSGMSANGMRRFSVEQIKLVQQLIEQCLKLYLSKEETMDFLCKKYENIERAFINLMWCKLEQQNPEFFKAYNTRLLIKEQISQFNQLVKEQASMMQQQGLLVQNNTVNQMPSTPTGGSMISVQQPMGGIGIMSGNIQSPYNSASSPVTSQNAFTMIPNQPNTIQVNNGMSTNNGAFVYPGVNGAGNFGINLQNAAVLGINNFQQTNNGMIPQNMNNNAVLNFAQQQQNMYRQQQQQPTNPQQTNFNSTNTLSPQKQQQMNVNLGLGNETDSNSNMPNMFNTNGPAGTEISQMITHLLSSPAPVSTTTPQAKQTIQNFLKSPLVKVGRDVEEKLRSLLNDEQSTTSNSMNVNNTDMNRQISNSTPVTNNSATGTSTPTILDSNTPSVTNSNSNTQNQLSETPNIDNVFEFPDSDRDVFGATEFDDDFFHHDE
ncbi:hypothetical protein NAEGRDRAFT_80488 [Naegleria gruberi]|uniref:Uncharacterized protein n=1 Tax=Naegleria gruberi TaxID=5762 RepID=D2VLZ0_NAEGR|nr:uncharacterized protein NAEGRDRAFT_80488 [Naegleria gruberi]EFC42226.1 hypothetical protein NAEGRDRAFT_80488 [Naegleria gruberi]|eukprot:XP_002674970.1 hypothetical protein NAEGRDRAFT_80488 [Naegleria gruberi strain NEG-M]